MLSWLLLVLYYISSMNECNELAFKGDLGDGSLKIAVGFGFGIDHEDSPHKGNLCGNLRKIVEQQLGGVRNLSSDEERKWYAYLMKF